jgi:MoxR-like ATPase
MMRIHLGYPSKQNEIDVLNRQSDHHPIQDVQQVVGVSELVQAQRAIRTVYVDDLVKSYIVDLVTTTRDHPGCLSGRQPARQPGALQHAARAWAAMNGRDFVLPDDVKYLAEATLAHRLIVSPSARIKNVTARQVDRRCAAPHRRARRPARVR